MTTSTSPTEQATTEAVRVAVIVGSIRTDRFCPVPARWIAEQARQRAELDVDLIDLADHDVPAGRPRTRG